MLSLSHLTKAYGDHVVLSDTALNIDQSSHIYTLIGQSGSGKTTLLNILFGIDQDYSGTYYLNSADAKEFSNSDWDNVRSTQMQIVYQDFKLLDSLTVEDNLTFANRLSNTDLQTRIDDALSALDLESVKNKKVRNLSGGQKQRVALARATINRPEILLLDEPTGNLDDQNTTKLMGYISSLKDSGLTILIITHDKRVMNYSDTVLQLVDGKIQVADVKEPSASLGASQSTHQPDSPQKTGLGLKIKYVLRTLLASLSDQLLSAVPIILIIMSFCIIFTMFRETIFSGFNTIFSGFDDRSILIDTQKLTDSTQKKLQRSNIVSSYDGKRIGFSEVDRKQLQEISNVSDVLLFSNGLINGDDESHNLLAQSLAKKELPISVKDSPSFVSAPDFISLSFESLGVPAAQLANYNYQQIHLLAGESPAKSANDLLIPDILAEEVTSNADYARAINNPLALAIRKDNSVKAAKKTYRIVGVYRTNYQQQVPATLKIYTRFVASPTPATRADYRQTISVLTENEKTRAYNAPMIKSFTAYQRALGTGHSSALIVAKNAKDIPSISNKIRTLFPKYQQMSQYETKNGAYAKVYRNLVFYLIGGSALLALILGVIICFLNKSKIKNRSKELAILYSLGYSKRSVNQIVLIENAILFATYYVLAVVLLIPLYYFYLRTTARASLFVNLFSVNNLAMIFSFLILTMIISVLWGINGVKKKNLRKYLSL
jgi:ABC-type lipoprotein export system ATPase subunit/ABC-type antimicrobial peptide transport system permease subunit